MNDYMNYSFSGTSGDTISDSKYNCLIGAILAYGFGVNAIICKFFSSFFYNMNPIVLIIAYFAMAITGIFLSKKSDNPIVSFIGYNLVVVPCGAVLSIIVREYQSISILSVCIMTFAIMIGMIIVSNIYKDFFLSLGRTLFFSLLIVIVIELIMILFRIVEPTFMNIIVAGIFALYIGYDWQKAQSEPKTIDNAVDACVDLYLDLINLFIRLLEITGKKKK